MELETELAEALDFVVDYINQTTGQPASQAELADALKRYFVLNEIKEHIDMLRNPEQGA